MEDVLGESIKLEDFAIKTYEKLRYADTDRQGHVNNAVFATMLETGRVEILFDLTSPLAGHQCAFVIANLNIDFRSEITWPGRVDIGTSVSGVGRSSFKLEQALFQDGRLAATASTVIVQMNEATRRSEPLSDAAIERLNRLKST
jgi:acyl-CoA thioester hydrolase